MKRAKQLLAVVLAFSLALSFVLPALAIEWDDFRIITQPQSLTIGEGESFTLTVAVNVPDGVVVEYQWYVVSNVGYTDTAPSGGPILTAAPGDSYYAINPGRAPDNNSYKNYFCKITGYEMDGEEIVSERTLTSDTVTVTIALPKPTAGELLEYIFVLPFYWTVEFILDSTFRSLGLLAIPVTVISPIIYLGLVLYMAAIQLFTFIIS